MQGIQRVGGPAPKLEGIQWVGGPEPKAHLLAAPLEPLDREPHVPRFVSASQQKIMTRILGGWGRLFSQPV